VNHLGPTCVPITRAATNRDESSATRKPMLAADQTSRSSRNSKRFETRFAPATERDARRFVVFPSRSPLRPRTITRAALAGGDPEGGGGGGRRGAGNRELSLSPFGRESASPDTPRTHNPLSLASLHPGAPSHAGTFFFFFFLFFFSTAGPPTFIIDALGPLRGQIEAKARTGRPVFASQRGLGLLLLLLLLPPHASMRTIGSEGAESDTTGPPLTTSRLSQAPAGLQGGRSAD